MVDTQGTMVVYITMAALVLLLLYILRCPRPGVPVQKIECDIKKYLSLPPLVLRRHWCDAKYFDRPNRVCLNCGKTDLEIFTTNPHPCEHDLLERERLLNSL